MAVSYRRSSSNWVLSLKVLLTSTAIFSIAVILKLSVPVMLQFIVSELPLFWSSVLSWLTPPYLYVVINGIIITIAASSRFHNNKVEDEHHSGSVVAPLKVPVPVSVDSHLHMDFSVGNAYDSVLLKSPLEVRSDFGGVPVYDSGLIKNQNDVGLNYEMPEKIVYREEKSLAESVKSFVPVAEGGDDGFVISRSNWAPIQTDTTPVRNDHSFLPEKPLVSVRFSHRRIPKASPEVGNKGLLKVTKPPKRHETLESTWKTITDGRPMPLARHLKKSDTWETHGRHHHTAGAQEPSSPKMKKSETFNDRNNNAPSLSPSPGSGKLKKEASLSHDELNKRVEAFIKKFNEEMRLQRQESLNQYQEMIHHR